jgi:hypothetical protein
MSGLFSGSKNGLSRMGKDAHNKFGFSLCSIFKTELITAAFFTSLALVPEIWNSTKKRTFNACFYPESYQLFGSVWRWPSCVCPS